MGKFYLHATYTISASALRRNISSASHRTLWTCTQKPSEYNIIYHIWFARLRLNSTYKLAQSTPYFSFNGQPLNQKGLVLRERQLSRRILHYTNSKLLWECRLRRACENIPWGYPTDPKYRFRVLDGNADSLKGPAFYAWHTMTEDYSSMLLTRDTDKLAALSGLAKFSFPVHFHTLSAWIQRTTKTIGYAQS
jgi:hypothetical protein